nr:adenosylcobinamide-GDP ribazoletransferase [uncultured Undibacterium sp.]
MNFIRHYLLALQFFTRIPVTGKLAAWVGYSPAMLRASAAHFPGVGVLVGACTAFCFWGFYQLLPHYSAGIWVAAFLSTVFGVMLTGAFHEDGLADLSDGLGGHVSREKSLDIMKDSRIGTYGAVALVLALFGKIALLTLLGQVDVLIAALALFAAHIASRLMPLFLIFYLPHVGDTPQSKSKPLAESISQTALFVAMLWCLAGMGLVCYLQPDWMWLSGMLGSVLALLWMWRFLRSRLQGFTGDALGATQQLSELGFYLGVLLSLGQ